MMKKNKKTKMTDGVKILAKRAEKNPTLQKAYEQESINFKIAKLIREVREEAGLTQTQLAKLIGTQQPVISRLEDADYRGHSLSVLQKIARSLGKKIVIDLQNYV